MTVSRSLFAGLFLVLAVSAALAETPEEIVAKADKLRNPDRSFRTTTTLIAYRSGTPVDKNVFTVFSKVDPATGQFRDIVIYADPPRDAGKRMLFSGKDLWFYDPASKASVRISPQQQLIGQASAGDVLTVNFAVAYAAKLLGTDKIQDANGAERVCYHLDLTPSTEDAIYNRIEYWVEENNYNPIKAKFYADSGRLLKVLYYRDFQETDGVNGPRQAVILDAVDSTLVTSADFGKAQFMDIPDEWFQRSYLPRIGPD